MLKKVVSLIITILILSINVMAEEVVTDNTVVDNTEPTIYTLTLNDAIQLAITDNPQLLACEIKKENYKTQLDSAKITKSNYKNVRVISVSTGYEVKYIKGGYYVDSYQSALNLCDYEYEQIKSSIAYNVTNKYYNYKNCQKLVDIAQNSYELVKDNYDNTKLSYDLGLVSKIDLDNVELALTKTKYMLDSYIRNLEISKEDLKISLGKNNEICDFVLTEEIDCPVFETDFENDVKTATTSRYDINALKSNYDLAKKYLDLTGVPTNTARYTDAYSKFITAEYNYKNNSDLIMLSLKSSYNNITNSYNDYDIALKNLSLKENDYKIALIKHENGMITNTELNTSLNDLSTAKIELENAKLTYKLSVEKYKYEISIGL